MGSVEIPKVMKAGQWDPTLKKIVINDIPVPTPGPHEFLVKIRSASLCHSDLLAINEITEKPLTLGHEGAGHIVSMHESAEGKGFEVGDPIGFLYVRGVCFQCPGCMVHNMYCQRAKPLLAGFVDNGYFQEYALVDYHNAAVLDEKVWDLTRASPVFCAGITAFNSIDSCDELKPGDWFGVVGCGGLGQLATQYAKAMGYKVVGIDIADANLAEIKKVGADAIFNSKTNPRYVDEIKKLTGGGVQAVAVYTNATVAFANAPQLLALGGTMMVIGIAKDKIPVDAYGLVTGAFKVKGDSTSIPQRMQKGVDFTAKHRIMPNVEIRGGLEALPGMVEEMQRGENVRRTAVVFD